MMAEVVFAPYVATAPHFETGGQEATGTDIAD